MAKFDPRFFWSCIFFYPVVDRPWESKPRVNKVKWRSDRRKICVSSFRKSIISIEVDSSLIKKVDANSDRDKVYQLILLSFLCQLKLFDTFYVPRRPWGCLPALPTRPRCWGRRRSRCCGRGRRRGWCRSRGGGWAVRGVRRVNSLHEMRM